MNLFFGTPRPSSVTDRIQSRLLRIAALFLFLYAAVLTIAPAVRLHTWQAPYRWEQWLGFILWAAALAAANYFSQQAAPERDPFLIPIAGLLTGWGLLTIWRLDTAYGLRQSIWLVICAGIFILGLRLPSLLSTLRQYKYIWLTAGLLLTALTFLLGTYPGGVGPHLWLGCCGMYFQPSEPLKLLLVIYLAAYLADQLLARFNLVSLLLPTVVLAGIAALLLVAQRDLGTALIILFLYAAIVYLASGRKRIALASLIIAGIVGAAGYFAFDVVRLRVDAWLNPWADPSGRSYQIVQSLIGIAAGGLFGSGPGLGNPGVVPVSISDFIFTAITEEMGLVGAVAVLLLAAFLFIRGLRIAFRAPDFFQRYLAAGLSLYLGAQCLMIIGGNLRLFPLTGVTLPFVSYGGSSLLTSFLSLLILIQISSHPDTEPAPNPDPTPYFQIGAVLLVGFVCAALLSGWWGIYQGASLQARIDNPRPDITDRYVRRGSLLDRNGLALATTSGSPGTFARTVNYPDLSPMVGYTSLLYGQTGLEASLDPFLRGLQGNPSSLLVWDSLAYAQTPPGLDVRTSLDLTLQKIADQALGDNTGGLVLINAKTGEILAMASHPTYNANQLAQQWSKLVADPSSPLLDRAAQGQYPPGTVLGPFLLVEANRVGLMPALPTVGAFSLNQQTLNCTLTQSAFDTWGAGLSAGCPAPLASLGVDIGAARLVDLYGRLGFFTAPAVRLPSASITASAAAQDPVQLALGEGGVAVSPLQMAVAAAGLSQDGKSPAPRLAVSFLTPNQGWVILPALGQPVQEFPAGAVSKLVDSLRTSNQPLWTTTGSSIAGEEKQVAWFIGGTLPSWNGTPLAVAVALEKGDPQTALSIGSSLLQAAIK